MIKNKGCPSSPIVVLGNTLYNYIAYMKRISELVYLFLNLTTLKSENIPVIKKRYTFVNMNNNKKYDELNH